MKTQAKSELWMAIRELYKWRRGYHGWSSKVFDLIEKTRDPAIKANCPDLYMAYEMWKAHPNEDAFFMSNNMKPEED